MSILFINICEVTNLYKTHKFAVAFSKFKLYNICNKGYEGGLYEKNKKQNI